MELKISLGQMDVALGQPEQNLDKATVMAAEARRRGSELVVFPELWSSGYDLANSSRYATSVDEGMFVRMIDLASEHSVHVMGSLLEDSGQGYRNTAVVASPSGLLLGKYSKVHLFRPLEEHVYLVAGEEAPVFDLPWGRSALAICYDLRFPELFRKYALAGTQVVFLVAEWPLPRLAHWETLLQARAIENQCFVVACNRVGQSGEWSFFGHSCIYDPSGELVAGAGDEETLLTATIDLDLVDQVRRSMTVFEDRREAVYATPGRDRS
ncbi:MAG: carbon-nitrogen family hydrolase [Anaerolineae bacterium]|nr:carbon-nitrogen family hydrolase [Anaerolineae bacterium]